MVVVTTYTQRDFDLLVALGMPDTQEPTNSHYFDDIEDEAIIEFCVSVKIAFAYTKIKGIIARAIIEDKHHDLPPQESSIQMLFDMDGV
jgi:hypothetical protein